MGLSAERVDKAFADFINRYQLNSVQIQFLDTIKLLLKGVKGVGQVLSGNEIKELQLDHERCGDIVVIADKDSWFTYYYWNDDTKAPDFARTVDIHKKPGYDPVEMYLEDIFTVPANIAGVPAISVPAKTEGLPVGIQFIAPHGGEERLFSIGKAVTGEE